MARPSEDEIEQVINDCFVAEETGTSKYPGMSYEQGVRAGIEWVEGDTDEHPLEV